MQTDARVSCQKMETQLVIFLLILCEEKFRCIIRTWFQDFVCTSYCEFLWDQNPQFSLIFTGGCGSKKVDFQLSLFAEEISGDAILFSIPIT